MTHTGFIVGLAIVVPAGYLLARHVGDGLPWLAALATGAFMVFVVPHGPAFADRMPRRRTAMRQGLAYGLADGRRTRLAAGRRQRHQDAPRAAMSRRPEWVTVTTWHAVPGPGGGFYGSKPPESAADATPTMTTPPPRRAWRQSCPASGTRRSC
jgi:hypothetical protein